MNTHLPHHLSLNQAQGVIEGEPIAQFEIGDYKNFVYLLTDWIEKKCAIVDPQSDLSPIRQALKKFQLKLVAVLLTHTHHDHVAGLRELIREDSSLPIYLGEKDLHRIATLTKDSKGVRLLKDNESFQIGSLIVRALHTPGHSAGECTYAVDTEKNGAYLFTGDTIFIRDCGRTDFPDGSNEEMFQSLQRVKSFSAETIILCGHHYQKECATTVGMELKQSPPFQCKSVAELSALP